MAYFSFRALFFVRFKDNISGPRFWCLTWSLAYNSTFWQSFDRSLSYNSKFWQSFEIVVEKESNSKRKRNILVPPFFFDISLPNPTIILSYLSERLHWFCWTMQYLHLYLSKSEIVKMKATLMLILQGRLCWTILTFILISNSNFIKVPLMLILQGRFCWTILTFIFIFKVDFVKIHTDANLERKV